jgi:hypothetical protein
MLTPDRYLSGFLHDTSRINLGCRQVEPYCLNVGMVELSHIQSAPSHHKYDPAKRTLRDSPQRGYCCGKRSATAIESIIPVQPLNTRNFTVSA